MRKAAAIIVMLMLALPSVAIAADINVGGEFEAAGVCQRNWDYDKGVDDNTRTWYGNLVLSLEARVAENISVFASYTLVDGTWGDGKFETDSGFSNAAGVASDDVAYAVVGLDSVTVTAGRQIDEWGHMLMAGGDGIDRFTVSVRSGGIRHALIIDKIEEKDQPDLKDDVDRYGLQIGQESEGGGYGLYISRAISNDIVTDADLSGTGMDLYYRGKLGPVELAVELAYMTGSAETVDAAVTNANGWTYGNDTSDKARMGFFLTAGMDMEPMTLTGTFAYASGRFTAGDYFTPTFMTGLDQDTARYNFGELLSDPDSLDGDTAMLIALGLDYELNDSWVLGARLAQHTFADDAGLEGTEVDLMAEYEINEGATWGLYAAYLSPDGFKAAGMGEDDPALSIVQSLFIEF